MRTFVMGDIHGQHAALLQCLERSGFNRINDRLIQLGDVIDRGPDSFACVEELLSIPHLIAIRGNHDEWFRQFLETGWHPSGWEMGAVATAKGYLRVTGRETLLKHGNSGRKTALEPTDVPISHRQFFERQVDFFIDEENNCYVHAGFNRFLPFHSQASKSIYYWDRELWNSALDWLLASLHNPHIDPFYVTTSLRHFSIFLSVIHLP